MGQIFACTRRKQLDTFDEEPKAPPSPRSPLVPPPVRETIYIAYVPPSRPPTPALISHIRVMGSTGSGKTTVRSPFLFGLAYLPPVSSLSISPRAPASEKALAWRVAPMKYNSQYPSTSADNK